MPFLRGAGLIGAGVGVAAGAGVLAGRAFTNPGQERAARLQQRIVQLSDDLARRDQRIVNLESRGGFESGNPEPVEGAIS